MMTTGFNPTTTAALEDGTYRLISTVLSPAEKTTAITKVRYLERELFDDSGHIRRGISRSAAEEMVVLINDLRHALGWLEIDIDGHWRWPA
jgi:hypothetical protein